MSDPDQPEIGASVAAGGIKTNYLVENADLHVFSHCGHWVQIERSADFNRLVGDFLAADGG